jgi:hypothetical protein
MPLLDHFRPPLSVERPWEGIHSAFANALAEQLNDGSLPAQYVALPQVHRGTAVEIDVATLRTREAGAATGLVAPGWTPREPEWSSLVDWSERDTFEVRVVDPQGGPRLVAAIELVSPANKDRPARRQAFAGKCAGYLRQGVGLIVVDLVTDRHSSLDRELLDLLELNGHEPLEDATGLYAVAYRTVEDEQGRARLDLWRSVLAVGADLPILPLWIGANTPIAVDLEKAYQRVLRRLRIVV